MAIIKNGILGGFSGKVGPAVGYKMYGKDCMRSLPVRTAPYGKEEIKNTTKFKLVQDTLSGILHFIRNGFKDYYTQSGGIRGAISYNRRFAIAGTDTDFYIDPEKFVVTGGDLPGAENPQFILETPLEIRFHWDTTIPDDANPYDQVMLLAIDFKNQLHSYCNVGAFRSTGTELLKLNKKMIGKELHLYIGFVAKDRSRQSMSQYLGQLD